MENKKNNQENFNSSNNKRESFRKELWKIIDQSIMGYDFEAKEEIAKKILELYDKI